MDENLEFMADHTGSDDIEYLKECLEDFQNGLFEIDGYDWCDGCKSITEFTAHTKSYGYWQPEETAYVCDECGWSVDI